MNSPPLKIWINGRLHLPDEAKISVFDSGFVLGDGVWEGIRVASGQPAFLEAHLNRLEEGAKALMLEIGQNRAGLTEAIMEVIEANGLADGAHLRLMVTRGVRREPYQDPRLVAGGATVVIIPGIHPVGTEELTRPRRLFTVHVHRGAPDVQDPRLNSHSKLNCITACIQANVAGFDEALMLDPQGFVATCNSTHFFIIRRGEAWTSDGRYCLAGVTRGHVLSLCEQLGVRALEKTFSLTDVYAAEEAFTTGTLSGIRPVSEIDGRIIGSGERGPVTKRLQQAYARLLAADVAARKPS